MQERYEDIEENQIDLVELFHALWKKAWAIILCFVIGAAAFGIYTKFLVTPLYSASSSIYVLGTSTDISSINLSLSNQLTSDFTILAKSRPVIERVIEDLQLDMTYEQLVGSVVVENPAGTTILKMTATNPNPELAKNIANAMAKVTGERVADVMDMDQPNVVESAVTPASPSSPNFMKNTMMGGLFGAVIAMGLIVVFYLMDDTIKTEEDVKKYLGLDTLAAFPAEKGRRR